MIYEGCPVSCTTVKLFITNKAEGNRESRVATPLFLSSGAPGSPVDSLLLSLVEAPRGNIPSWFTPSVNIAS